MADRAKSAVVTGVSSGIGRAIAECLLDDVWRVFGSVRNEQDAAAAKEVLGAAFTPLVFDITDGAWIAAAASHVNDAKHRSRDFRRHPTHRSLAKSLKTPKSPECYD